MNLLSTLQLSNVSALAGLLLVPLLVFAYLKQRSKTARVVSSVMILQTLAKRTTIRRRFKPPLRFFLELLALLLLTIAASRPSFVPEGGRVAVVLDTSMSMHARQNGVARLELAGTKARKWLDSLESPLASTLQVSIYRSSPKLSLIGAKAGSLSAAKGYLSEIKASYGTDNLSSIVTELAESAEFDKLLVVSDKSLSALDSLLGSASAGNGKSRETKIYKETVGEPLENPYLAGISIKKNAEDPQLKTVSVTVAHSGQAPVDLRLTLFSIDLQGSSTPIRTKKIRTNPGRSQTLDFIVANRGSKQIYKAQLAVGDHIPNAITEDDQAWVSESTSASGTLLLVGPDTGSNGESALGLSRVPSLRIRPLSPDAYNRLSDREIAKYSSVIFHKTAPAAALEVPTLLVLPPAGNSLFPISGESKSPKITSWANTHPLTSYLKVPLLRPSQAVIIEVPDWAQSVVNTEEGSLIAAGESRGIRFAAVGMELFPFEGAETPSPSILLLNLLNWLRGTSEIDQGLRTGGAHRLESGVLWKVDKLGDDSREVDLRSASAPHFYPLDAPGAYRFQNLTDAGDSASDIIAVNNFYPQESASFEQTSLIIPDSISHRQIEVESAKPLWPYLILCAFILVLAEFTLHLLSGAAKGEL